MVQYHASARLTARGACCYSKPRSVASQSPGRAVGLAFRGGRITAGEHAIDPMAPLAWLIDRVDHTTLRVDWVSITNVRSLSCGGSMAGDRIVSPRCLASVAPRCTARSAVWACSASDRRASQCFATSASMLASSFTSIPRNWATCGVALVTASTTTVSGAPRR